MKRFVRTVVSVLMVISLLGVSSCSVIRDMLMPGEETYAMPEEETGTVTIPDKGCSIEFPERKPYEYDMELILDTEKKTVGGHVVIDFYNDSTDTWKELCLRDYPSLFDNADVYAKQTKKGGGITEITNVNDSRSGELEVERDGEDDSVVWLKLDKELKPGSAMKLSYDFVAKIPDNPDRFGFANDIYNVTNFYPILAEYVGGGWSHAGYITIGECFYSEISNYNVRLTVPEGYTVASTGETKGSTPKDGKLTYTFEAPYVRDFVFCASKVFANVQREVEGVKVNLFYNKENQKTLLWALMFSLMFFVLYLAILMDGMIVYTIPTYSNIFVIFLLIAEVTLVSTYINQQSEIKRNAAVLQRQVREKTVFISEINRDLVLTNKRLMEGEVARKNVLSNVSHDLRTPITAIRGYAELLLSAQDNLSLEQRNSYLSNILYGKDAPQGTTAEKAAVVRERMQALLDAAKACGRTVVFVSNEVGSGIVPDNAMAREYRDISGWVNQQIGEAADHVFYVVAGQAVDIKRLAFRFE